MTPTRSYDPAHLLGSTAVQSRRHSNRLEDPNSRLNASVSEFSLAPPDHTDAPIPNILKCIEDLCNNQCNLEKMKMDNPELFTEKAKEEIEAKKHMLQAAHR